MNNIVNLDNVLLHEDKVIYFNTLTNIVCNPSRLFILLNYMCGERDIIRFGSKEEYEDLCNKINRKLNGSIDMK